MWGRARARRIDVNVNGTASGNCLSLRPLGGNVVTIQGMAVVEAASGAATKGRCIGAPAPSRV